jgi:hypothetical protein
MLTDNTKAKFHLSNAIKFEKHTTRRFISVVWAKNGAELHCKT